MEVTLTTCSSVTDCCWVKSIIVYGNPIQNDEAYNQHENVFTSQNRNDINLNIQVDKHLPVI